MRVQTGSVSVCLLVSHALTHYKTSGLKHLLTSLHLGSKGCLTAAPASSAPVRSSKTEAVAVETMMK
ncbi:hypothetical protein DPEC_G00083930 [Dallia pectoralis]|uniref:Uncharacterized protein n=1 Tax=Dallia pectoralis TaxID=75939 RepID=A0ACC2GYX6_DALPE|nr:hypothetical protein DPEC_G00083930 [Dallia pectoralis]